ncbi:MAG: ammonium transporter [Victivallaceae bacterium]|nr:ammonium transporter [Victivallaceae bacterium]
MKFFFTFFVMFCFLAAPAAEIAATPAPDFGREALFSVNNLWVMIGAMLVFIMHLGFACVESGLARAKNCTNILFKNTMTPAIGFLSYAICGFAIMYPNSHWLIGHLFGFAGWGLHNPPGPAIAYNGMYTYWTDFFFQGMFAATAATIVSGAVAERIKLSSYLCFTAIYVTVVYPLVGSWGWGGGWLNTLHFHDFAGSTFVHSVGGFAALAGILLLGPRIGKYVDGKAMPLMGHNMSQATIGVFLLWFGWFGFNGASALSANPAIVSLVLVNTMLAASAALVSAMCAGKLLLGKPDLSMTLNGCLAGLVGITAGADCVSVLSAIIIGLVSGVLVTCGVLLFDKLFIDDPVGALSVHLLCGVWGTLAVGIFSPEYKLLTQLIGVAAVGSVSFGAAYGIFFALKKLFGIRVSETTELKGLDLVEHGAEAYPGFQFFSNM